MRQEGASRTTKLAVPRFRPKYECVAPENIRGIFRKPHFALKLHKIQLLQFAIESA